jgi:hypothetical protein
VLDMKNLPLPEWDVLNEWFRYNPATGKVYWRKRPSKRRGLNAAGTNSYGYVRIVFRGTPYAAHRIIWKLVTGKDPGDLEVDHKDLNRANNRWKNLRLATDAQQNRNGAKLKNNTTGYRGVTWANPSSGKARFRAATSHLGKRIHLGTFDTREEASTAYETYCREHYGDFHRSKSNAA